MDETKRKALDAFKAAVDELVHLELADGKYTRVGKLARIGETVRQMYVEVTRVRDVDAAAPRNRYLLQGGGHLDEDDDFEDGPPPLVPVGIGDQADVMRHALGAIEEQNRVARERLIPRLAPSEELASLLTSRKELIKLKLDTVPLDARIKALTAELAGAAQPTLLGALEEGRQLATGQEETP